MKLDDWVGNVKAPMGPRKLELFNTQGRKVPQTNDGLCGRNESLREIADVGARMELGRMRMSKSRRTAKLRTSISQAAYLVGCSQEVTTMDLRSCASWQATV